MQSAPTADRESAVKDSSTPSSKETGGSSEESGERASTVSHRDVAIDRDVRDLHWGRGVVHGGAGVDERDPGRVLGNRVENEHLQPQQREDVPGAAAVGHARVERCHYLGDSRAEDSSPRAPHFPQEESEKPRGEDKWPCPVCKEAVLGLLTMHTRLIFKTTFEMANALPPTLQPTWISCVFVS